jgi:4-aminobutyrate aminotransferase
VFRELSDDDFVATMAADLREVLATCTAGDVAALIAEPIQGVGGFTVPPDGLFGALQEVLREHGILYISDEVQTGWGRTGDHFWGFQAHGVEPDMITFAKGLGNGLPMAGVIARGDLMDTIGVSSISTFGGNPLVCAGALANLDYLLDHDLQANAATVGSRIMGQLRDAAGPLGVVGDIRGKGLMVGVELVGPDGRTPEPEAATAVLEQTRRNGVLVGKGGLYGNCLRVAPPLSLTIEEAERGTRVLIDALRTADAAQASRS